MLKKITRLSLGIIFGIIYALSFALTLVFVEEKPEQFWVSLVFAYIPNIIVLLIILFKNYKRNDEGFLLTPLFTIFIAGNILLFITELIFLISFGNKGEFASYKTLCVTYSIELALYLIATIIVILGVGEIRDSLKETQEKVSYIRDLKVNIDACAQIVKDDEIKKSLLELAESIRFSDPMSHSSLSDLEKNIKYTVDQIEYEITCGNITNVPSLIEKANNQLKFRNSKCLALKK